MDPREAIQRQCLNWQRVLMEWNLMTIGCRINFTSMQFYAIWLVATMVHRWAPNRAYTRWELQQRHRIQWWHATVEGYAWNVFCTYREKDDILFEFHLIAIKRCNWCSINLNLSFTNAWYLLSFAQWKFTLCW